MLGSLFNFCLVIAVTASAIVLIRRLPPKRQILVSACMAIGVFAGFLILVVKYSHTDLKADYPEIGVTIRGEKRFFSPPIYQSIGIESVSRLSPDFVIHWKHIPYSVSSLTPQTLKSLGFWLRTSDPDPSSGARSWTRASCYVQKPLSGFTRATLRFENDFLREIFVSTDPDSGSHPFGFSYRGGLEMELPLTPEKMESILGKPARVSHSWNSYKLLRLLGIMPKFAS